MDDDIPKTWVDNRTLVYTWLLFAFPIGLYAVWKGALFDKQMQWIITGVVVAVLVLVGLAGVLPFFFRLVFPAVGIYLCWKDPSIAKTTTYMFAGAAVILLFIYLLTGGAADQNSYGGSGSSQCAATITQGSCTYFRDSQCNVIGQVCQ